MSVKKQLAAAVDELPEAVTVEDAFARLYHAFKQKQLGTESSQRRQAAAALRRLSLPVDDVAAMKQESVPSPDELLP